MPQRLLHHGLSSIAATSLIAMGLMILTGAATPPRSPDAIRMVRPTRPATAITPLEVHPDQFRDPRGDLPSWLVQLDLEPSSTPDGLTRSRESIDAVIRDAVGLGPVTQRYEHAVVGFAASMSAQDAARLLADPRVRRVEPDLIVRAATDDGWVVDPDADGLWGLRRISTPDGLAPAYDPCGANGAGVTVVVIDSGITADHSEFDDRVVAAVNFNPSVPDASDGAGHGTHVAGTIAGRTVGVAPSADIVALRVFGPDNSGPSSAIVAALNWMASPFNLDGPAVANMSLGGPVIGTSLNIYFEALSAVVARGIPIVAAASNFSYPARWSMPAASADTICVGATGMLDRAAVFSSNGPTVDLWAPGVNILSADSTHPDGGLKADSGTSMAAPMTTGVVALHLQRFPPDPATQADGGRRFDVVRRTLAVIAAAAEGRVLDWTDPAVVAIGANGALAGAANRLLQACPADEVAGCDDPLAWHGHAASVVLGDGITPLPPGFACSRVVAHPTSPIELTVQAPALLPIPVAAGPVAGVAADVLVTDLSSNQIVWAASSSWFTADGFQRSAVRRLIASGLDGFRIDWISYRDDLPGGYGYAMTATIGDLEFLPAADGDAGTVGSAELGELLAAWGPCSPGAPCLTDLDGDGVTGSGDLGVLLSVWGESPVRVLPGFGVDCAGNPVPLAWLGDEHLDSGNRSFVLDPLTTEAAWTVDLDCERLQWDAPEVGTGLSSNDPRPGAAAGLDGGCEVIPLARATSRIFLGHGTDCSQVSPLADLTTWCSDGSIVGDIASPATGPNLNWWSHLVRQPLPGRLRDLERVRVIGLFRLRAPSNSNLQPTQYQRLAPHFDGTVRVTVSFTDGTTSSVLRTPSTGLLTAAGGPYLNRVVEAVHADDGREIAAICLTAASDAPGLAMDRVFAMQGTALDDDDPAPGAEYSPDNGRTWYPLLADDGRRLQILMCIEGR